jgi:O-antigen/teichoic acid export membrane protein
MMDSESQKDLIEFGGMFDLRGRTVRGGTIILVSQVIRQVLSLGITAVLARLLTPEDFGLLGMIATFTVLLSIFGDMGLSMASVQKAELRWKQISTLFWINLALGMLLTGLTAVGSPLIAWFYGEPRLVSLTLWISLGFVIGAIGAQHKALMTRRMQFGRLAISELAGLFIAGAVGIWMALQGYGVYALVGQTIAGMIVTTVCCWILASWVPGPPVRKSGMREMLRFGGYLTGFNFMNYFNRNLDNVLIGRFRGAPQLAIYSKAYHILLLPIQQINTPISRVVIPALSRLQSTPERYRSYYLKAVMFMVALGMPMVVFMFVSADKVILLLLGDQWIDCIAIFRALGPAAFLGTFNVATGWVYISLGQTQRQFRWGILVSSVIVLSFIIGLRWGAIGVAAAYSIAVCAMRYPSIVYCFSKSHLKVGDLMGILWKPALASMVAGAAVFYANRQFHLVNNIAIGLIIDFSIYGLVYILCWAVLPRGRQTMLEMLMLVKDLRRESRETANANS